MTPSEQSLGAACRYPRLVLGPGVAGALELGARLDHHTPHMIEGGVDDPASASRVPMCSMKILV